MKNRLHTLGVIAISIGAALASGPTPMNAAINAASLFRLAAKPSITKQAKPMIKEQAEPDERCVQIGQSLRSFIHALSFDIRSRNVCWPQRLCTVLSKDEEMWTDPTELTGLPLPAENACA